MRGSIRIEQKFAELSNFGNVCFELFGPKTLNFWKNPARSGGTREKRATAQKSASGSKI
jgi:hypothetical protein